MTMDRDARKRLIDIIAGGRRPERLRKATDPALVAERLGEAVAPGQLWGVDDREACSMALVSAIPDDRRLVRVVPVGDYEGGSDSRDHVVFPDGSPTGFPLIAYREFETTIPVRLLSFPYGPLDDRVMDDILSSEIEYDPYDEGVVPLARRMDVRDRFERWHALCDLLPELHDASESGFAVGRDIRGYLEALRTVLGLTAAQCLAVRRGTLRLTDDQERRMSEAGFGNRPRTTGALPRPFAELSEQPRWRFVADDYISRNRDAGMSPFEADGAARGMLARRAFALAARAGGSGDEAVAGLLERAAEAMTGEDAR